MAEKELTVYVVDLGNSMGKPSDGQTDSKLDLSLKYLWSRITATVYLTKLI
jgi:ATP-dependent DNA helicase 2 subunit 2